MTVRVHINGREFPVKETVRAVKKTFEMQKKFMALDKNVQASQKKDASNDDILSAVDANLEGIDEMAAYIADVVNDKEVTTDYLLDNVTYEEFGKLVNKLISKILHVDDEDTKKKAQEKESVQTSQSETSTNSDEG